MTRRSTRWMVSSTAALSLSCAVSSSPGEPAPRGTTPGPSSAPPAPAPADPEGDLTTQHTRVRGVVEAIRLTNINKARGQFTYVVTLIVHPHEVLPGEDTNVQRWVTEGMVPPRVSIRVDKLYWGSLPPTRQAELAPGGPSSTLHIERYGRHAVGQELDLQVHFTSPGLADPIR